MPVVEAVGLAVSNRSGISVRLEAAMKAALDAALKSGEQRPHVLKKRMLAAREDAKKRMGLPHEAVA